MPRDPRRLLERINAVYTPATGRIVRRCPDSDPLRLRVGQFYCTDRAGLVVATAVDPVKLARSLGL